MFKDLAPGDVAILMENGVYKQCQLATYNGQLFAKLGSGYVRLNSAGGTSKPSTGLLTLVYDGPLFRDRFGRLCVQAGEGRREIFAEDRKKLLAPQD